VLYKNKIKRKKFIRNNLFYIKFHLVVCLLYLRNHFRLFKDFDKVVLQDIEEHFYKGYTEVRYYLYEMPVECEGFVINKSLQYEYEFFTGKYGMNNIYYNKHFFLQVFSLIESYLEKYRKLKIDEKDIANDLEMGYHRGNNDSETYFYIKIIE